MNSKIKKVLLEIVVAVLGIVSGFISSNLLTSCSTTGKVDWDAVFSPIHKSENVPVEQPIYNNEFLEIE